MPAPCDNDPDAKDPFAICPHCGADPGADCRYAIMPDADLAAMPLHEIQLNEPEITTLFQVMMMMKGQNQCIDSAILKFRDLIGFIIMEESRVIPPQLLPDPPTTH